MIQTMLPDIETAARIGAAVATDAAFAMGAIQSAVVTDRRGCYRTHQMTSVSDSQQQVKILTAFENIRSMDTAAWMAGIRPIFQKEPHLITGQSDPTNRYLKLNGQEIPVMRDIHGQLVFEYGAFPATAVDPDTAQRLEAAYRQGKLIPTRHFYTTDDSTIFRDEKNFIPRSNPEFEFKGQRYVRLIVQNPECFYLSTGEMARPQTTLWVRVEPIRWIYRPNIGVYAEKALLSGIRYQFGPAPKQYRDSFVAHYLGYIFDREMMQSHDFFYARQMSALVHRVRQSRLSTPQHTRA